MDQYTIAQHNIYDLAFLGQEEQSHHVVVTN